MPVQPRTLSAFRHHIFRMMWLASVVSNTGSMIQLVGASWLMTLLTSSEQMVALVQACLTMPVMVFSVAAGVLADNYERRSVMLVAQALMLIASVTLAALAVFELVTPWLLLTFTFAIGLGTALHNPSWQASFTDFVPREDVPSAATMNAMGMNITRSLGPAVGGLVVAGLGVTAAFAINAGSFIAFIVMLIKWRPQRLPDRLPREGFFPAFGAGMRYLSMSPNIINISVRGFLFGFSAIPIQALLPLVARDNLNADAFTYGILLGSFGLGAVLGAFSAARIRTRLSIEWICRLAFILSATAGISVGYSKNLYLTIIAIFIAGACWVNINNLLNVAVQMSVPRWVLGRMISLFMTALFGGMAVGSWTWGVISEAYALQTAFVAAASVLITGALWGLIFPIKSYPTANLDPLNHFREPSLQVKFDHRNGPMVIMIEYKIAPDDVEKFLDTMTAWRRIRIRDGAKGWSLLHNVEAPCVWIEKYHLPSWNEYVRHVARRTVADAEVMKKLAALHRGNTSLTANRLIERQPTAPVPTRSRLSDANK
jgi:MFS family permease